jgi:hypothetical protein
MTVAATPSDPRPTKGNAYAFLILLLIAFGALFYLGFAKSFFVGKTFGQLSLTPLVHIHAATMILWYLMLIVQAWLVRTDRISIHRMVGRSSYVVAPLVVVSTLVLAHAQLGRHADGIAPFTIEVEVFTWGQTIAFAITWALAIWHRKRTPLHMRYMISTAFAACTAITLRGLLNWGSGVLPDFGHMTIAHGILITIPLLALIVIDWKKGIKFSPYWVVTIVLAAMHIGFFTFAKTAAWASFVEWFVAL